MPEPTLQQIWKELMELKAMISQLGPATVTPPLSQEIAAVRNQGGDVAEYLRQRSGLLTKKSRRKRV